MTPKRTFMAMLGVLAITLLAGFGAFYWSSQNLDKSAKDISALKAENDILDIRIAAVDSAQAKLNELSDIRKEIAEILPPEKIQSDIIAQILDIASDNNITLNGISFPSSADPKDFSLSQTEPLKGVGGVRFTTVTTDFTTSFNSLLSFLNDIEKNQRLMQISNVNISPNANGSLGINIGIQIYVKG